MTAAKVMLPVMGLCALLMLFPQLLGRSSSNEPLVSDESDKFTLNAIRFGAAGTFLVVAVLFTFNFRR